MDCFASHLATSAPFRKFIQQTLSEIPYRAYRWECPPATAATMDRPMEFVVIDDSYLDRPASDRAFAEHLRHAANADAITFANLGGDAILVVPTPTPLATHPDSATPKPAPSANYCHLGSFTQTAPLEQQLSFWQLVGQSFMKRLGAQPVWLSTAGDGVPWLHVRLDDYPKYYAYAPYRNHAKNR